MTNAEADSYERLSLKSSDGHFSNEYAMAAIADLHAKEPEAAVCSYTGEIKELQVRNACGLRDEFLYSKGLMALMERKSCLATFVKIPGHKIYGYQASWSVIFRRHHETMIPGNGEHFRIRMPNVPFTQPDVACNICCCKAKMSKANPTIPQLYDRSDADEDSRDHKRRWIGEQWSTSTPSSKWPEYQPQNSLPAFHEVEIAEYGEQKLDQQESQCCPGDERPLTHDEDD